MQMKDNPLSFAVYKGHQTCLVTPVLYPSNKPTSCSSSSIFSTDILSSMIKRHLQLNGASWWLSQ